MFVHNDIDWPWPICLFGGTWHRDNEIAKLLW